MIIVSMITGISYLYDTRIIISFFSFKCLMFKSVSIVQPCGTAKEIEDKKPRK